MKGAVVNRLGLAAALLLQCAEAAVEDTIKSKIRSIVVPGTPDRAWEGFAHSYSADRGGNDRIANLP